MTHFCYEFPIGVAPQKESVAPLITDRQPRGASIECRVYRRMLMRRFQISKDGPVRLVIKDRMLPPWGEEGRVVCIQCVKGYPDLQRLFVGLPDYWDQQAYDELIWYSVRHVMYLLASRGWTSSLDTPAEFMTMAPPESLSQLLENPLALYSRTHSGGPFERKGLPADLGVVALRRSVFVGRMWGEFGRAVVVRLGTGDWALYRPNLQGPIARFSGSRAMEDRLVVRMGSTEALLLEENQDMRVFEDTGVRIAGEGDSGVYEVWRPTAYAMEYAVSLAPLNGYVAGCRE